MLGKKIKCSDVYQPHGGQIDYTNILKYRNIHSNLRVSF
jgi:hypothetical protein